MRKPNRVTALAEQAPADRLHFATKPGSSDERLIELVRALARCAAQRYTIDSETERACDGS